MVLKNPETSMRKLVGRNAARLRKAADLTQEQLAERAGMSQQYIRSRETGTGACPLCGYLCALRQSSGLWCCSRGYSGRLYSMYISFWTKLRFCSQFLKGIHALLILIKAEGEGPG